MLDRQNIKIFIASSGELADERVETILIITELNKRYPALHIEPVLFEFDTSSGNNPGYKRIQDTINPLLDESDIIFAMFYSRIGEFTKEEFDRAKSQNKKIFLYLKKGFSPSNKNEGMKYQEVLDLKEDIESESEIRYETFEKLSDFHGKLYKDLQKYLDENVSPKNVATDEDVISFSSRIPFAPRPYYAPSFGLSKSFTGRAEEMNMLSKWFLIDKEPVFILEAIGGMGKSSLAWQWLQNEIVEKRTDLDGVVWWSFYNQGFDDFIDDCFEYCLHEPTSKRKNLGDKLTFLANLISNKKFLLVLDGFETQLRGYAGMMGVYQNEKLDLSIIEKPHDLLQRECVNPKAEKFLKSISSGSSKVLLTTRLFPEVLEHLKGVAHKKLTGLSETDVISFFKNLGIDGSPDEIIKVAKIYDFHPLMLNHLAIVLSRNRIKNINEAYKHNIIDQNEPQKILNKSYSVLNDDEKKIVTSLSVFRLPFEFDAILAIFPEIPEDEIWKILMELVKLGFLSYEESDKLFDFHPVNRLFLYSQLTNKKEIHQKAVHWLENKPEEIIQSPEDLIPVFELVFHLIKAGLLTEAFFVYDDRLFKILGREFERPIIEIDLLMEFIKDKQSFREQLTNRQQSHILATLGTQLSKTLKSSEGLQYLRQSADLYKPKDFDSRFYSTLTLQATTLSDFMNVTSSIILTCKGYDNITSQSNKAAAFRYLAICLKMQKDNDAKLDALMETFQKKNDVESRIAFLRVQTVLCIRDTYKYPLSTFFDYFMKYTLEVSNSIKGSVIEGVLGEIIYMHICLAKAIIKFIEHKIKIPKNFSVSLLNNEFSGDKIDFHLTKNNLQEVCCSVLNNALLKIRETGLIYFEAIVLLQLAKIEWLKANNEDSEYIDISVVSYLIEESLQLAKKDNDLVLQSEIHLFCAEILLSNAMKHKTDILLCLNAQSHLETAKSLCLDRSKIEDIYKPTDDMDGFYEDIPEYNVLKRGLTEQERIELGNYQVWKQADDLLRDNF